MFAIVLALLMLLSACSSAPPTGPEAAKALIDEAAAAMGGWAMLDAVKSQEILVGGGDWEPMQAVDPNGEPRTINTFGQSTIVDFERNRMRLTFDAIRVYPTRAPVKFAEVIDGDAGMLESVDATGKVVRERLHPSRYATRLRDVRRLPLRVLYTAKSAPDITRVPDRNEGNKTLHILHYTDGGMPVELQIDSFNKLPMRIIYTEDDTVYGDTLNEVAINNTKLDEAALTVPPEIRSQPEIGDRIVSQWILRRVVMGVGYQDFARPQKVDLVEVSKGVYHVKGSSHHSMAIEMKDHLVLIEAPLYEERSAAVIKALEEKIPGKPIKYVVMTHFHIDHSGGLRAYAAKGATIIGPESAVPFLKTMLSRPKTVRPDSLAKAGNTTPNIEGVKETKSLTDGDRTIELIQIENPHVSGMLVAYLPAEKVLFVSDLYTPGTPVEPTNTTGIANAVALDTAITGGKLSVDRIVGGHGDIAPLRDLAKVTALPKS